MVVVQPCKPVQRLLQVLRTVEVVRTQHLAESSIEAFDHAVGLWRLGFGQPVFDAQALVKRIELVLSRGLAAAQQPICELFTVVRQDGSNLERHRLAHCRQEGFGGCCRFVLLDSNEYPAGGPVDGHEHIVHTPTTLIIQTK